MLDENLEEFIYLIKKDINKLNATLKKDEVLKFSLNTLVNSYYYFDFSYFVKKVNEMLYNFTLHGITNHEHEHLSIRLDLFKKVFLIPLGELDHPTLTIYNKEENYPYLEKSLLILLLYHLFHLSLRKNLNFMVEISRCLKEWLDAARTQKINSKIIIPITNRIRNDYIIEDCLSLKLRSQGVFRTIDETISNTGLCPVISVKLKEKFYLYKNIREMKLSYKKNKIIMEETTNRQERIVRNILCTLYLNGFDFKFEDYITIRPWFLFDEYEVKEAISLLKSIDYHSKTLIEEKTLNKVKLLYPLVIASRLFSEENNIILYHNYLQQINRDFVPDSLFNIFVLFEFIFGKDIKENITFWFSFNIALFISEDKKEFLENFLFMKDSYRLRSALFHGDDWLKVLESFSEKYFDEVNNISVIWSLRDLLNQCLIKIIKLKQTNPFILEEVKELDKIENKERKLQFLFELYRYNKKRQNIKQALKMLYETIDLIESFSNNEEQKQKVKNIMQIFYNLNPKLLIFEEELKKIIQELEIVKEGDNENSTHAKLGYDNIIHLVKIQKQIQEKNDIHLEINGNDIKGLLKIEEGPLIGDIIKDLKTKVKEEEIENDKKKLELYIKENYEASFD